MVLQLVEDADFVIALDGAADRFDGWDIVVGDMDLSRIHLLTKPVRIKKILIYLKPRTI